jgi:hypothetical protein
MIYNVYGYSFEKIKDESLRIFTNSVDVDFNTIKWGEVFKIPPSPPL